LALALVFQGILSAAHFHTSPTNSGAQVPQSTFSQGSTIAHGSIGSNEAHDSSPAKQTGDGEANCRICLALHAAKILAPPPSPGPTLQYLANSAATKAASTAFFSSTKFSPVQPRAPPQTV
jgi:hypothetical protein